MNIQDIFSNQSNVNLNQKISKRQLERGYSADYQNSNLSPELAEEQRHSKIIKVDDDPHNSEEPEDDRFYQDGLSSNEKKVFDWVEQVDEPYKINLDAARKIVIKFEKSVSKNTELRLKYPNDPAKFIDSEADLDESILDLQSFSMNVKECFPFLIESGSLETLVNLLTHENKDIIIDVIQVVGEWTAEDSFNDNDEEALDELDIVKDMINALKSLSFFQLLGNVLASFNEDPRLEDLENDKESVYKTLSIIENISTIDSSLTYSILTEMNLISYLINRIQKSFVSNEDSLLKQSDSNRHYSSEILSIVVQLDSKVSSALTQQCPDFENKSGLDIILHCISKYRKVDPIDEIEFEFVENLFNVIISLVLVSGDAKSAFLELEGIELICLMLEQKNFSRVMSLKLLDFIITPIDIKGDSSTEISAVNRLINCGGYNSLCKILMKKNSKYLTSNYPSYSVYQEQYRISSIFSYLFRLTLPNTKQRWTILSKFVPYANAPHQLVNACKSRIDRLIEIHFSYSVAISENINIKTLSLEDSLFGLQMIDSVLSILSMNDENSKNHIYKLLKIKQSSLDFVKETVLNYIDSFFTPEITHQTDHENDRTDDESISTDFDDIYSSLPGNAKELYLSAKLL
ncbi:Beta-catenin-like protein 1-like protein [Smittium culicis]|uniref:Beta-catenin-like protein 1-like protein n=1 Tax=Smittium culicis TaxID=133412 RepID=A0A1R1XQG1_9FUNG|nr:Beta-catenin-like protein 1-like protein [Smittium culicis]